MSYEEDCKHILDEEYRKIYLDCIVKLSVGTFGYGQKVEKSSMERIMKQARDIATLHYNCRKEILETNAPI